MEEKEERILKKLHRELDLQKISPKKQKEIISEVREKIEKEGTMKLSVREGASSSAMTGFGDSNITPFALALNASNFQIGLLSSSVGILAPISQVFGSRLLERFKRKNVIVNAVTLQALMWIPILVLGILYFKGYFQNNLAVFLILFYSLYAIFGAMAGPSWFSLMGDIVPEKIRGRYFSKRNKITGSVALLTTLTSAFFLDYFKTKGLVLIGFSILFFFACIFRLFSAKMFTKHYEPKLELSEGYYFGLWSFIKKMPSNNFGRFVMFIGFFNFAVMIGSPFFTVYMLRDLGFSYTTLVLVTLSASLFSLLTLPVWGKLSDRYGNREMMKFSLFVIPLICFLWAISPNPIYLIFVPQILNGMSWAGFNLSASNFIYDSVSPQRRGLCVAYYSVIGGIGTFFGALVGGILAQTLTINFMNKLLFIILISGVMRAIVPMIFLPRIKEVRKVRKKKEFFQYLSEFRPTLHLVNLKPMSETIDLVLYHVKRISFVKKTK
jgi:MFS family permease